LQGWQTVGGAGRGSEPKATDLALRNPSRLLAAYANRLLGDAFAIANKLYHILIIFIKRVILLVLFFFLPQGEPPFAMDGKRRRIIILTSTYSKHRQ